MSDFLITYLLMLKKGASAYLGLAGLWEPIVGGYKPIDLDEFVRAVNK